MSHDDSERLSELTKRNDSTFELHYFRSEGQAGVIRNLLVLSKANWKDRFETLESWPAVKASTPFGTLPVLYETMSTGEVLQIPERDVIERYLANKFGFYGKNEWEQIQINVVLSLTKGLMVSFYTTILIGPESELDKSKEKFLTQLLPNFSQQCESILGKNKGNPHFVGNKTSLADVTVAAMVDMLLGIEGVDKIINQEATPLLLKVKEAIDTNPDIQAYRKSDIYQQLTQASHRLLKIKFPTYDSSRSRIFA